MKLPIEIEKIKVENALYLVATPIGNIKDISIRALEVLNSVDVVFCEDTRVTKKLLNYYNVSTKQMVYNDHSKQSNRDKILGIISAGGSVALVSDAGTPLISDPGYKLVRDAAKAGVKVSTCPGASSVISALSISGLKTDNFYFAGFLPQNEKQKENYFRKITNITSTLIFMDRGSRLKSSINAALSVFGDVEIVIAREITKIYEEVISKKASDMLTYLENNDLKGEIILLIDNTESVKKELSAEEVDVVLKDLKSDNSTKSAAEIAYLEYGINKKLAYKRLLEL